MTSTGALVAAGTAAAVTAMAAESRLGPRDPGTSDPSSWLGILPSAPPTETARGVLAAMAGLGVVGLCVAWFVLLRRVFSGAAGPRAAGLAALAWTVPFLLGPPLFSRDAYAYAAQGELARHGLDPATHGVAELSSITSGTGLGAFVAAVDPRWRDTHTPYGGLAVAVEKYAAVIGDALGVGPGGVVAVLRAVAAAATVALVLLTLRLLADRAGADAGPAAGATGNGSGSSGGIGGIGGVGGTDSADGRARRRAIVLALVAANPMVIIHLVGGAHLDALAAALLVAALVTDRARAGGTAGTRAGSTAVGMAAVGLAALAGSVKATAFLGLGWLVFVHVRDAWGQPRSGRAAHRMRAAAAALGADAVATGAALALGMIASGFGPTWIGALSTSGKLETAVAPASVLATAASAGLDLVGLAPPGGRDAVLAVTRALTLAAAGAVVIWLALAAWRAGSPGFPGPAAGKSPAGGSASGEPAAGGSAAGRPTPERPAPPRPERRDDLVVVGFGGMAVALGSPVLYPWYLALAVPMLAVLAARAWPAPPAAPPPAARRTVLLVAVTSCWLCLSTTAPLGPTWRLLGRADPVIAAVAGLAGLAAVSLGVAAAVRRRRAASPTPRP